MERSKSAKKKVVKKSAKHKQTKQSASKQQDNNSTQEEQGGGGGGGGVEETVQDRVPSTTPLTGNRKTTDEERKEIRAAFDVLDEDGDGKLGFEEMTKLLQSQFMSFTDAAANEVIQKLDEDGSGEIEFEEFEKYVIDNNLCKPTVEEFSSEMKAAFEMFDTDNNGHIDAQEFRALMGAVGDMMPEEEIAEMMREADTNGDGLIDYKEFCTHMAKNM